jgi:hypothetical protein
MIMMKYIRKLEGGGTCGTHGKEDEMYNILVAKPEGKQPLGRPRRRWEDGIRMDLREIGWGSVECIQLAQDRNRSFLYQQHIKAYGGIKGKIHAF